MATNRVVTSVALTPEQMQWLKKKKISLSTFVQEKVQQSMDGIYDEDREAILDDMYRWFLRHHVPGRTSTMTLEWIKGETFRDDLQKIGMTPMGFRAYCRKRVEADKDADKWLRMAVGLEPDMKMEVITQEQLDKEKIELEKKLKPKGLKVVRKGDDARPVTETEEGLYGVESEPGRTETTRGRD